MKKQSAIIIFLILVIISLTIALTLLIIEDNKNETSEKNNIALTPTNSLKDSDSCPADISTPIFNHIPMSLDDFRAFRPLGFVTIPTHFFGAKHSSFSINIPGEPTVSGKKVEFPSNATVTQITSTFGTQAGYQLVFYPCKEFKSYFFHLSNISDKLKAEVTADRGSCYEIDGGFGNPALTKCEKKVSIKVESGEIAGYSDQFAGVDFGAVDYRSPNTFANSNRYDYDYLHYTSPILYFTPELRTKLESKLASYDGQVKRIKEPLTGSIVNDVIGTAAGNWFVGDASFFNQSDTKYFLALIHDYVDPEQPIIVITDHVKGVQTGIYSFEIENSGFINRDFKDVKPENIYCYENFTSGTTYGKIPLTSMSGSLLIKLENDTTLLIEKTNQTCSNEMQFSSDVVRFDR